MVKSKKSELTKLRILDVAKDYFLERGFKDAHVSEIASLAFLDRRTIYRYFPSKESLLLNIVNNLFDKFILVALEYEFKDNQNGHQKISALFGEYFNHIQSSPELPILLGMIDVNLQPSSDLIDDFMKLSSYGHRLDYFLENLITEGQSDGSVLNKKDPKTLSITINNSLLALVTRTAIYSPMLRTNPKAFSWKYVISQGELLLDALKVDCD